MALEEVKCEGTCNSETDYPAVTKVVAGGALEHEENVFAILCVCVCVCVITETGTHLGLQALPTNSLVFVAAIL